MQPFSLWPIFFWHRLSLRNPECPGITLVDQSGFQFRDPHASASQVLDYRCAPPCPACDTFLTDDIFSFFIITFIHLHLCLQKSEDNLLELALSFCHVVPEDWPQTPCWTSQEPSDAVYFLTWRCASTVHVHQTHGKWCGSRSQLVALLSLQTWYSLEHHWKARIHAGDRIASLLSLRYLWGCERIQSVCWDVPSFSLLVRKLWRQVGHLWLENKLILSWLGELCVPRVLCPGPTFHCVPGLSGLLFAESRLSRVHSYTGCLCGINPKNLGRR